ncbi:hypothetical protein CXY45_002360 [Escherichia coli]|uniref:Uncharacterized protein n=1 Tax=Escherichia coli TaxID=562 RepID=A0A1C7CHM5_ECOLX|nr:MULTISPECIES: hypothetical protein [Escherichia]EEZ9760061.1 hypothetical protein [Escherichia coli O25]EFA4200322.1 hypothetical protein [Escherichia coli O2:H32]EFN6662222.1 hypothetical protein [Escherichia coli O7:H7]EGP3753779.1 hypothetical protein [Salmonella enterica]HAX5600987.1 hypothetical protein [Escherichia coli O157]
MANSSIQVCTWSADFWCKFFSLFKDENQYVTWFLVLVGWGITAYIAYLQTTKSRGDAIKDAHNEWIGEFRQKLELLEDFALEFWAEDNNKEPTLALAKMSREVKSLTTIAKEIERAGGEKYKAKLFKELRQAMTYDSDVHNRPLRPDCMQIVRIRETCASLRSAYGRKSLTE